MTLVKIDHPRRIDRLIAYFGDAHRAGSNDPGHEGSRDVMATAFAMIEEQIRANTAAVLEKVDKKHVSPRHAALDLATAQVKQAMSVRRFSIL